MCLNKFSRLATKEYQIYSLHSTARLWGERWILLTKDQLLGERFYAMVAA